MLRKVWLLTALTPLTAFAQNDNFQCSLDGMVRRVEIVYETGVAVPCEVHYYKDTEAPGERQVLWTAQNESGYCESKTRDFMVQLQSWGWQCESSAASADAAAASSEPAGAAAASSEAAGAAAASSEAADDTEVLSAPEGEE